MGTMNKFRVLVVLIFNNKRLDSGTSTCNDFKTFNHVWS